MRIPVFCFIVILLSSCTPTPSSDEPMVIGYLYTRYLQEGNQLKATASFFQGDSLATAQPISLEGGVAFQGSGMGSRNLQGEMIRYQYENQVNYPKEFVFNWKNPDGKAEEMRISMPPLDSLRINSPWSLTKGGSLELFTPLKENEGLVFLFTDENNKASSASIAGPLAVGQIDLSSSDLSGLHSGNGFIYLVKKQLQEEKNNNRLFSYTAEYYTKQYPLILTEE
jgi:hypothetical protein